MGKFTREKAADLDLIKWQYIKSDEDYRKCYDSISDLFEVHREPVLSEDFMKRRKLKPSSVPVIKDVVGDKVRKRLRSPLNTEEQSRWDSSKEWMRDCWDLAYPVDYREEMPEKLQFVKNTPVRSSLSGLPHRLHVEIDLRFTREAILESFRKILMQHQKAFKSSHSEKDTLKKLEMKVFAFEMRTYRASPVPYKDIVDALESKYPGKIFGEKTVQKWVSDFAKSIKSRSYLKLK